jgi:hypothetical protein
MKVAKKALRRRQNMEGRRKPVKAVQRPTPHHQQAVTHKVLSLRDSVNGAVVEFLDGEGMACIKTQEGLVRLINKLAHYTEEGRALFPQVFIFDSLENVVHMMPSSEHVAIGDGPKNADTMERALKKCAPLARAGWSMYIERRADTFVYGLLRSGAMVLSLGPAEMLVHRGDSRVPVLMLHQVGTNVIELKGVSQSDLLIHFGALRATDVSPFPAIINFVDTIVRDVPAAIREQAASFYRSIMTDVLHAGHGTLGAVVEAAGGKLPKQFGDAIVLAPPISVASKISDLLSKTDAQSNTCLRACGSLITGMMLSDGITVFATNGSVRAYNVFVKHPEEQEVAGHGGARERTFHTLSEMTGRALYSAFMQSQDGHARVAVRNAR